jgi:predicted metal-dependent hydrolase
LCHLVHADHSKQFWQLVERHCPDFAGSRYWLKDKALILLGQCAAAPAAEPQR